MIDRLIAFLKSKLDSIVVLVIVLLMFFVTGVIGLADDRVDVEIYKDRESGEMTYCETGTLVDPPYIYMGSGKISETKASTC